MSALAHMMVVSKNRLEGSLGDVPLADLLNACHKHLVTGAIKVCDERGKVGVLILRAGAVDQARFANSVGDPAVNAMLAVKDGTYEIAQQLPDLSGGMGHGAKLEGSTENVGLVPIMRHCEQNALSCVITVINEFDRGEIHYRAGELEKVTMNGHDNDDAIVTMLEWKTARYRISAPPLHHEMPGWPKVGREETQPFRIDQALLAPARGGTAAKRGQDKPKSAASKAAAEKAPANRADKVTPTAQIKTKGAKADDAAGKAAAKPAGKPASKPASKPERRAAPLVAAPESNAPGTGATVFQAFLLTLAAVLALTLVALLAAR